MDLDAILDQALDDFEDQEVDKQAREVAEASKGLDAEKAIEEVRRKNELMKMMASMQDPNYGETLQSTLKQLSGTSEGVESVDSLFEQLNAQFENNDNMQSNNASYLPTGPNDEKGIANADREVAATLQMIGSAQAGMEGFEAGKMEAAGENMMEEMMAQFEALGEKEGILYTMHYTLYTVYYILYTIYYILYTVYYILYTLVRCSKYIH